MTVKENFRLFTISSIFYWNNLRTEASTVFARARASPSATSEHHLLFSFLRETWSGKIPEPGLQLQPELTVRPVLPWRLPKVAVMVAVPAAAPVTKPALPTVATAVFDEDQATSAVIS